MNFFDKITYQLFIKDRSAETWTAPKTLRATAHIVDLILISLFLVLIDQLSTNFELGLTIRNLVLVPIFTLIFFINYKLKGSIGKKIYKLKVVKSNKEDIGLAHYLLRCSYAIVAGALFLTGANLSSINHLLIPLGIIYWFHQIDCLVFVIFGRNQRIWDKITRTAFVSSDNKSIIYVT